jgi:hypothetical protein
VISFWDELGDDLFCEIGTLWGEMNECRARDIARQGSFSRPRHARREFQVNVLGAYETLSCAHKSVT